MTLKLRSMNPESPSSPIAFCSPTSMLCLLSAPPRSLAPFLARSLPRSLPSSLAPFLLLHS
eukprot:572869-Hanusia_phi.AAC.1